MSSSLDKLTWIRCMWGYIKDPSFAWHKPEKSLCAEPPGLMITDGKFLKDLVIKTAVPNCQEWRATIEVMLLKYRQIIPNAAGSALLPCWQAVWRSPWTQPFYAQFCSWEYSESMMKKWPSNRTRTRSMVLHGWSNRTLKIDQCEFSNLSLLNAPSIVSCQGKHIHHVPFDSWLKANFSERGVKISSAAIGLAVWWRVDSLGFGWIDIYIFGLVANTPVIHINYILVNKKDLVSIFRWERLPVELGSDPTTYIYNDIYIYIIVYICNMYLIWNNLNSGSTESTGASPSKLPISGLSDGLGCAQDTVQIWAACSETCGARWRHDSGQLLAKHCVALSYTFTASWKHENILKGFLRSKPVFHQTALSDAMGSNCELTTNSLFHNIPYAVSVHLKC